MANIAETVRCLMGKFFDGLFYMLGVLLGLVLICIMLALMVGLIYVFVSSNCIQMPGNGLLCLT